MSFWDTTMFGMLNQKDPSKAAMGYINQIPGQLKPYYDPYMTAGTGAMSSLQDQYGQLINDPGAKFNQMGESFQKSPGFDFAMQQALQGSGHAAAAGGMAGSPQHEQQNQQLATNLANQDYYNYMNHAQDLYGMGLSGEQGLMNQGFNATKSYTDQLAQALAAQAGMKYAGQASKNKSQSDFWGDLMGGGAAAMKFL